MAKRPDDVPEVLSLKLRRVDDYLNRSEAQLDHIRCELAKAFMAEPPPEIGPYLEEMVKVLKDVFIAGPSRSLIQEDLEAVKEKSGEEHRRELNERASTLGYWFGVVQGAGSAGVEVTARAVHSLLDAFVKAADVSLLAARRLREDLVASLNAAADPIPIAERESPAGPANQIRWEGEDCVIRFEGVEKHFPRLHAGYMIAELVRRNGEPVDPTALWQVFSRWKSAPVGQRMRAGKADDLLGHGVVAQGSHDLGPVLDDEAKEKYRQVYQEYAEELEEAKKIQ